MVLPRDLSAIIDFFHRLPGIGPKSARRLGFYLLRLPQEDLDAFTESVSELKKKTHYCTMCMNLTEDTLCSVCSDQKRDKKTIVVVEEVADLLSFESGTQYDGVYHILHGRIDPISYIGPDDIFIPQLIRRIQNLDEVEEVIIATNPTTEGEATAMYIASELRSKCHKKTPFKITRLANGLPIGADVEYADYLTLKRAIEGRREI